MCFPESYPDANTQHGHISLKNFDTPIQEENRILSGEMDLVALNKRALQHCNSSDYSSKFSNTNREKPKPVM